MGVTREERKNTVAEVRVVSGHKKEGNGTRASKTENESKQKKHGIQVKQNLLYSSAVSCNSMDVEGIMAAENVKEAQVLAETLLDDEDINRVIEEVWRIMTMIMMLTRR